MLKIMSHHGCDDGLVDLLFAITAAILTASVVIMGSFLVRYRQLVKEAEASTRLAKDVWDAANSRFSVVDTRIIDLMAKTEVLSSRVGLPGSVQSSVTPRAPPSPPTSQEPSRVTSRSSQAQSTAPGITTTTMSPRVQPPVPQPTEWRGTDTEVRVLQFLVDGPRSSADIKANLNMTREHVARLMKTLFDRGLVVRNDRNKPYVYEITESGLSYVAS
jgi:biotin operon repressor